MAKIPDNTKKAIIGLIMAGAALSQIGPVDGVRICETQDRCQELSGAEYVSLKKDLADRVANNVPIEWGEFQLYLGVMNHELQGGRNLGSVKNVDEIKNKLNQTLYEK